VAVGAQPPARHHEIAFKADTPGVWMDHCHNLPHAADGLVAHLAYAGVTTPFRVGGRPGNAPE
jgi:FtsP/CotA-like multicopper oxidase with cupredoxin domain